MASPVGEKSPVSAEAVPAAEPQHHGQERVVDEHERECCGEARGGEAEVGVGADEVDGEPGREGAQQVVGEIEEPDVPGVAFADPLWNDHRDCERDEKRRRKHERAGDDECRRRVQAVVAPDRDAEERRDCRKREQDCRLPPLVRRRDALAQRGSGSHEREYLDQGGVRGRCSRQPAYPPRLPARLLCHCWNAHLLPHLVKVTGPISSSPRAPTDNRQRS